MKRRAMGKRLIIAEKPSVGRDIANVLNCRENGDGCRIGENDIVTWAVGHLVGLCYPDEMDNKYTEWRIEDLPIFPEPFQLKVLESSEKQFEIVKNLMNDPAIDSIVCATDAGREGELIFRYIYQMAGCNKPVDRLWISSLTYRAIKEGFENLKGALSKLDRSKYLLLVFGGSVSRDFEGFEAVNLGYISDDLHLSLIYNAADVFVAPSFQDNLPNTVMEALSCGVPVAAFNIGGMPDMIVPGENGYLAKPFDWDDLAKGIEGCADQTYDKLAISREIREKYSSDKIGKAYLDLYSKILSDAK